MDTLLNWYFSWDYNIYLAIALIVGWTMGVRFFAKKRKSQKKDYLTKQWWFWAGNILVVLNLSLITWINPAYWGYGDPVYFNFIQVTNDHVLLYDIQYSYHEDDNSTHEEDVPNLRIHVIDRNSHEKLYTEHIGDYFFPIEYGKYPLIAEKDTYYDSTPDDEIQSLSFFDVTAKECKVIAKDGMIVNVDGVQSEVFDIFEERGKYLIKTVKGDIVELNRDEPLLNFIVEEKETNHDEVRFSLSRDKISSDKSVLKIEGESTGLTFLKGNIVNRIIQNGKKYVLIYSLNSLKKMNPKLSLVNEEGQINWDIDLNKLKKITEDDELEYIHRSLH